MGSNPTLSAKFGPSLVVNSDRFSGDGDGSLNHYYDVEARDTAAVLDLAVARQQIAAEEAAAGRLFRYPRFDEPGGKLLQPGEDDEPCKPTARPVQFGDAVNGRRRAPPPLHRGIHDSANASSCARRSSRRLG